jgi:DNA processing protein
MEELESVWAGLAAVAPRVDLWNVLPGVGGPEGAPRASREAWKAAGLREPHLSRMLREPAWGAPGIRAGGEGWPAVLEGLPEGPVALTAEGDLGRFARTAVAIVGARACTPYGRTQARRIAEAVVAAGGVVVSGLAAGIDAAAHEVADGATIAVLGQGLRAGMPAWQSRLRERILERGGLVLSEFPPLLTGDRWTYPVRNRIIAALARVVVVVEASMKSGALLTAGDAVYYGRTVLAVPGQLDAKAAEGCLNLLEQGARLVRGPATVVEEAGLHVPPVGVEARVLAVLGFGASPEEVVARSGLGALQVCAALSSLESAARIIRLPGGRYRPP